MISGVCVIAGGSTRTAAATTAVQFRALDDALIDWYLASGEWRERAGGYAIQGRGAALVAAIEGDYTNVVGLPVPTLLELAPWLLPRRAADMKACVACCLGGFARRSRKCLCVCGFSSTFRVLEEARAKSRAMSLRLHSSLGRCWQPGRGVQHATHRPPLALPRTSRDFA